MTRKLGGPALVLLFSSWLMLTASVARGQSLQPPPPLAPNTQTAPPYASSLPSTPVMPPTRSKDEADDSGLGLEWVWINADVGGAFVNMQSFSATNLGLTKTESAGPAFGVGLGVRLIFITLGVRVRDLLLSSIGSLWELNAEAALHTRIWHIDPYIGVRGGYNFVGSLNSDSIQIASGASPPDVSVHGFNVGPMIGIDYYFAKVVSIGVDADAQFLFLQRPKPTLPAALQGKPLPPQYQTLYNESGSSVGFGITGTAHLGIHF
ncbi:MAG: hypothetical protein M3O46_08540 [Myxococcota bacterium]|nr:hypothetical protein [Myxococcota bacterium]